MTQPIILSSGQIRTWGERRAPLPRTKAYAFSLDLAFASQNFSLDRQGRRLTAQGGEKTQGPFAEESRLYHVQDEVLVQSADGVVRNIPEDARIIRANLLACDSAAGGADLDVHLLAHWEEEAYLSIEMTGVLVPCGSLTRLWSNDDTEGDDKIPTRVSIRTECESANFRWLVQNQLFGWGHVRVRHARGSEARKPPYAVDVIELTYDLYSMGG